MKKIILRNKLTNDIMELEGTISAVPEGWELVDNKERKTTSKKNGNGQGTLYYSETLEKWVGQISLPNGKRMTLTQRKKESTNDFKKRYRDTLNKVDNGTLIEKSKDTLYEILSRYIEQKYKDGTTSPRSYKRDKETLKQLEKTCSKFVNIPIQKVCVEDIEDAKENIREYSSSVIDKIWILLRIGFKIAVSRKKIMYNIMEDETLKKPISKKQSKKIEALTIKEENKLREILNTTEKNHKYRDIILLQLNFGMRIGEVLARRLSDVDLKENTIHIWNTLTQDENYNVIISNHTKIYNKKQQIDRGERILPLDIESREILSNIKKSELINMHNLLFWDYECNDFIKVWAINSWLDRINKKYHISKNKLATHVLRHTKITRMREANIPLPVIQYSVGQVEGSNVTDNVYVSISQDFVNKELNKANML